MDKKPYNIPLQIRCVLCIYNMLVSKRAQQGKKNQEECDQRNNIIPFFVSIKIFIGLLKKDKVLLHVLHLKVCSRRENLPT